MRTLVLVHPCANSGDFSRRAGASSATTLIFQGFARGPDHGPVLAEELLHMRTQALALLFAASLLPACQLETSTWSTDDEPKARVPETASTPAPTPPASATPTVAQPKPAAGTEGAFAEVVSVYPRDRFNNRWLCTGTLVAKDIVVSRGEIEFDNVRFHYGKKKGVIENLSLNVRSGEKVGIVGRSGAGKSTLVNILLRFYDLESGRITIDGQDISQITQDSLRAQIGVVTQDTSLLHRSVRDNILYGRPDATDEMMREAARRAEIDGFIEGISDPKGRKGYDAHVGERGVKLSGGQRQRVAIARVMLKDAPILILDEATSALDSEVEAAIQENLYRLMEGKTVIAIAHRLSTIAAMDRLVVMDKGRIVEEGTHDQLVARGGLYARLWQRQSGGFLLHDDQSETETVEAAAE